jgi:ABC-2 type transport system permease protein
MRPLVSAELLKLRSTRSAWIPLAAALAYAVLAVVAATSMAGHGGNPPLSAAWLPELMRGSGGKFVNGAVALTAIILTAGEFRHRTSVTTFLAEPRRLRAVRAKLAAAALTGVVVGLLAEVLSAVTAAVVLSTHGTPLHWTSAAVRWSLVAVPLLAAGYGVLGASLGLLVRNTAVAVGAALLWALVIEGILPSVTRTPGLIRWLPGNAANAVLNDATASAATLAAGAAAVLLIAYTTALAAAAATATVTREIGTTTG